MGNACFGAYNIQHGIISIVIHVNFTFLLNESAYYVKRSGPNEVPCGHSHKYIHKGSEILLKWLETWIRLSLVQYLPGLILI